MAIGAARPAHREQINVRASADQRAIIDQAAALLGKSRTDFLLESALRDAANVLLDQRVFRLPDTDFAHISALLDNPPAPSAALRALLAEPAPWE